MNTRYDQLAKQLLRESLQSRGSFTSELEVSPDPQFADGYFVPNLDNPSPIANTLLGRMTRRACSFDAFSTPPAPIDVEACLRKQFNLRHLLRKSVDEAALPHHWILSSGKPSRAINATWARPAPDWPHGVLELSPIHAASIIVINALPEDRSTLLVRLMGRGRTLRRAIAELKSLSDDEVERCIAIPLLVRYRFEASQGPASSADEEFIMDTQEIMNMFERRAERRGERRGKLEGRRETVLRLLQRKFGVLADDIVARVQNADATLLEHLEDKVLFANSIDEMFPS